MTTAMAANDLIVTPSTSIVFSIPLRMVEILGVAHVELGVDDVALAAASSFEQQSSYDESRIEKRSGNDTVWHQMLSGHSRARGCQRIWESTKC